MPLKPKSNKRGSKSASFEQNFTGSDKDLSDYIRASAKYFTVDQPTDDDDALERIAKMFEDCANTSSVPTVEKLALCLGTTIQNMNNWVYDESKGRNRALMIKKAKQIIASIDAEAVLNGKLNVVCYLFRAKNFYGMSDNVTVEHKATLSTGDIQDQSMLVGALLKQLQGQATMPLPSDYQPQPEQTAIAQAASDFRQATMPLPSDSAPEGQATFPQESSDYQATMKTSSDSAENIETVEGEIVSDYQATIAEPSSDYESDLPSDYAAEVQATINPLSALGKALAEELAGQEAAGSEAAAVVDIPGAGADPQGAE